MNPPASERRINADQLRALVTAIFCQCDMDQRDATLLADSLLFADLSGVHSHGVLRVPEYVAKLTTGGVNPHGAPRIERDSAACLVVDGDNSMGQIGTTFAMQQVIERAYTFGIAAAGIGGSNHCGALAYFARMTLEHDMIGLATTNALPTMAAWGGTDRILGINPLAMALPADKELPILYDAAFSGSSHGKIRIYQQKGWRLPPGWAFDRAGNPTIDPAAAIDGLLAPIGGFKGAGLAMLMGLLASLLSGAAYGTELGDIVNGPHPGRDGHFVLALRVSAFTDVATFKQRVDQAIQQVHASALAPGFERVYAPGEIEAHNRADYRQHGIPLNAVTLADLAATGAAFALPVDFLMSVQ